MTLPANIRINLSAPFPSLVQGSGIVVVGKQNGIWTVAVSVAQIGSINPPLANYPTDFLIGYDSVAQSFFKISITNLAAAIQNIGGARNQRAVSASPIVVAQTDQMLNINISGSSPTCTLPAAASRNGIPVSFVDVGGNFAAHPLTITPFGSETIDGSNASITLSNNNQVMTLTPLNDGTNTGWIIT